MSAGDDGRGYGPEVTLHDPAYVHPTVRLYGRVTVEEGASLWPYAVARAECHAIRIGRRSNVQDFVMLHVAYDTPVVIGEYCSITHHTTLHGCTIGDNTLVGINCTIMDGCVIGANCIVGGHTILPEGTVIPDNSVVIGAPGKVRKTLNSFVANRMNAELYHRNALAYAAGRHDAWRGADFDAAMAAKRREHEEEFARRFGS